MSKIDTNIYQEISRILFIDIETVPAFPSYSDLNDIWKSQWDKKAAKIKTDEFQTPEQLYPRAGIYAEFGKIICISTGFISDNRLRIRSFYNEKEYDILNAFGGMIQHLQPPQSWKLCAHNGKEFDFPYIARRMLINGIKLPPMLDHSAKKPWEIPHIDTLELWKFGDFKNYTSLDLLCFIFGIKTPKDDMDGSIVHKVYYQDNDLERTVKYCEKDVSALASLMMKFKSLPLISEENTDFLK